VPPRIHRLLSFLGALGSAVVVGLLWYRMRTHDAPQWMLPAKGFMVFTISALIAAIMRGGLYQRVVAGAILLASITAMMLGVIEVACRAIRLDFNELLGARRANAAFPIYFRQPTHQTGEVFFTRTPNSTWTGKPLQTLLKNHHSIDSAYSDEKEVTIRYSREGFRNPDDLADWDVAVVGDSFTESGYLPEEVVFTGVAATKTGLRIKNLGITDTGNFAHVHYLDTYGKAPACKTAVLAFFEGNDLNDNVRELAALEDFSKTGIRPSHEIPVQTSLLKAMWGLIRDYKKLANRDRSYVNAFFKAGTDEIPVSIADAPPGAAQMTADEIHALELGLDRYVTTCKKHGMKPHLLYLPCKRRVMHGLLRHGEDYPQPDWQLGDLPQHLAGECASRGIHFIDATTVLARAANEGQNTFNTIYDTHFNPEGHRLVGELLAEALKQSGQVATGQNQRE
jgi:hypothetical protein